MRRDRSWAMLTLLILFLLILPGCVGGEEKGVYQVDLQLPPEWESIIDMDALSATSSTPYIGTIRFVVQSGSDIEINEFPWLSHAANLDFGKDGQLTVQAIAAGQVIMDGQVEIESGSDAQLTVALSPSGGFSHAGTLLFPRQKHSVVPVGDDLYILGGTPDTGVIELLTAKGDGFASTAWAASLVYPRVGQEVVYDAAENQLFVFGGANPIEVDDDLYEVMDITNLMVAPLLLSYKRYSYQPILYKQEILLLGGFDIGPAWREDTGVISTQNYSDYVWTGLGSSIVRDSPDCIVQDEFASCLGGGSGQIEVFNLDSGGIEFETNSFPPINYFSVNSISRSEIVVCGGLEDSTGSLDVIKYHSGSGYMTTLINVLSQQRYLHTATLIADDKLLIIGGGPTTDTATSAEILDLTTNESTLLPWRMRVPRTGHTATLLPDGRVLVVGGNMTDPVVEVWRPTVDP